MSANSMSIEPEDQAALRAPFATVGKLPKVTCPKCRKAQDKVCADHKKGKCAACGNYITEKHMHVDYVGHADVTDRLLQVDPLWSWEPLAFDQQGLPAIAERNGEAVLWIRLTVCGVTRLGAGSVAAGTTDVDKQLIGDALRNAAMRFGVALDLWTKHEQEAATVEHARSTQRRTPRDETPNKAPASVDEVPDGMVDTRTAKRALVDAYGHAGHLDPKGAASDAWKAARIAAGPIPQKRLDKMLRDVGPPAPEVCVACDAPLPMHRGDCPQAPFSDPPPVTV